MDRLTKPIILVVFVIGLGAVATYLSEAFVTATIPSPWAWPDGFTCQTERSHALDEYGRKVIEIAAMKQQVIQDLVANTLTLEEAGVRIRNLTPDEQIDFIASCYGYKNCSRDERLYQVILIWVNCALNERPEEASDARTRLNTEMAKLLKRPMTSRIDVWPAEKATRLG